MPTPSRGVALPRVAVVAHPLANAPIQFDSGQLGTRPRGSTASVNRTSWQTPANRPPGTYTYCCRIHAFMRGVFRIVSQ